jgi:hypothetical protein
MRYTYNFRWLCSYTFIATRFKSDLTLWFQASLFRSRNLNNDPETRAMIKEIRTFTSVVIFISLSFIANRANADMCDDFKSSVTVEPLTTELSVKAGADINIPLKIKMSESEAKRWNEINMIYQLSNGIEGSKSYSDVVFIKDSGSEVNVPSNLILKTTEAMDGFYALDVTIYTRDSTYSNMCNVHFASLSRLKIEIKNTPERTDIIPPILTSAKFKQAVYKEGDTLELLFQAEDKSDICTVWKEQNGICHSGTQVILQKIDGNETIEFHDLPFD